MNLDDEGNPTYGISETMRTSATLPVVHNTTKPPEPGREGYRVAQRDGFLGRACGGFTREYEVDLAGTSESFGRKRQDAL